MSHDLTFKLNHYEDIIFPMQGWISQNKRVALITLIGVVGRSPRPLGSQMIVDSEGNSLGNISSGCCENSIIVESLEALKSGKSKIIRYGKGSPFIDIVLPCGSSLDIFIDTNIESSTVSEICSSLENRKKFILPIETINGTFQKTYLPKPQIAIFGKNAITVEVTRLAKILEFSPTVYSYDENFLEDVSPYAEVKWLSSPNNFSAKQFDRRTAAVVLFHDHDYWEPPILSEIISSDAFYLGALGSKPTHEKRMKVLSKMGIAKKDIDSISGPIGLDIGAKSPPEIAFSILSEIIRELRNEKIN